MGSHSLLNSRIISSNYSNIFKDKRNPKKYYIVNNDGIVEEYKLNFDDSSKKKKLIEEAIKDKEVLSKIYDELLDTTAYDEVGMNDEFQLSRNSFMNLSSIEDMSWSNMVNKAGSLTSLT